MWPMAQADPLAAEAQLVADDPAAFSGVKEDYDRSRRTLTRTGGCSGGMKACTLLLWPLPEDPVNGGSATSPGGCCCCSTSMICSLLVAAVAAAAYVCM